MTEVTRSEQACPVCGKHELALDELPRIDVMGVQAYSDMLGMGDLLGEALPAIVCLGCGARWRDKSAFDRNEQEIVDDLGEPIDEPDLAAWAEADTEAEDGLLQ
jgi:hypothetical protein